MNNIDPGSGRGIPAPAHGHDDHGSGGPSPANPESVKVGHEPDRFYVKPILSIPFAVVVTFIIAFGVVTIVFGFVMVTRTDPMVHPAAAKEADRPLNERLAQIDRKGANSNSNVKVDNSRNEANQLLEENGQTITRLPLQNGYNSPILHAEDVNPSLRPDKVAALTTDTADTVTIDKAIADVSGEKKASVIPVSKAGSKPSASDRKPTGANAGRGPSPRAPKLPDVPTTAPATIPKVDAGQPMPIQPMPMEPKKP